MYKICFNCIFFHFKYIYNFEQINKEYRIQRESKFYSNELFFYKHSKYFQELNYIFREKFGIKFDLTASFISKRF